MERLHELAPEEIAAAVLLMLAILLVAVQPHAITRVFDQPWSTPAPGGGPARAFLEGHGGLHPPDWVAPSKSSMP